MSIDTAEIETLLVLYPTPWVQETDGMLRDANGKKIWDVPDANDDPDLAGAIMRLVNQIA